MSAPCAQLHRVEAHFARRSTPEAERALRLHLPECATCTARYEALRAVERAVEGPQAAQARLGAALGFAPERPAARVWLPVAALAAAAALAAVFVVPRLDDGFSPRGGTEAAGMLEVYRLGSGTPSRAVRSVGVREPLAFAYRNAARRPYLLVFAVGAGGKVAWYHPAWRSEAENPRAIAIVPGGDVHELKEAVTQTFEPGRLVIYGVFLEEPLTVKDAESRLAATPDVPKAFPGAPVSSVTLEVTP